MTVDIKVRRQFDYENRYDISVETQDDLSAKEYAQLIKAIKIIQGIMNPKLDSRKEVKIKKDA